MTAPDRPAGARPCSLVVLIVIPPSVHGTVDVGQDDRGLARWILAAAVGPVLGVVTGGGAPTEGPGPDQLPEVDRPVLLGILADGRAGDRRRGTDGIGAL